MAAMRVVASLVELKNDMYCMNGLSGCIMTIVYALRRTPQSGLRRARVLCTHVATISKMSMTDLRNNGLIDLWAFGDMPEPEGRRYKTAR